MRLLSFLVLLGLISSCSATPGSVDHPNTPADGSSDTEDMCLLDKLEFTNGLQIIGEFVRNKFHYTCSCADWGSGGTFTTQVKPRMRDGGSSAEITFNSQPIHFRTMKNAISNDGKVPLSPLTQSSSLHFKGGKNKIIVGVGCNGLGVPETCYYQYVIECTMPTTGIVGDPQFVGLRGQEYQVHGVSGEIYNIVSEPDFQYNSRFVFLNSGRCPVVDGVKQRGCWSHPGSYLGEIGLKTVAGDRMYLESGSARRGFTDVTLNNRSLEIGETIRLDSNLGSITLNTTHVATIQVGVWEFVFENSDHFMNQRVKVVDSRRLRSHGLLGQTWREATYPNTIKYIQGDVDDYVIRDNDIFGDSFVYNAFN